MKGQSTVLAQSLCDMTNDQLLREYKRTNDLQIKQEITMRYIYIVRNIATQMKNIYSGFAQLDDIIDEGVIVLMTAIDKFDIDKNVKFSTYVAKRIRGMIIDLARKQDWVPRGIRKLAAQVDNAANLLYSELGRMPTNQEMADFLKMPLSKYEKMLEKSTLYYIISLDTVIEESLELHKPAQAQQLESEECPEDFCMENEIKEMLTQGIKELTENEQLVLSLHYVEEMRVKDIAQIMHLSAPRISQIHTHAIHKLKLFMQNKMR